MKNSHIARKYGVTPTTVSNWIESAKQKRNQLQLHYTGKKYYILDNENNQFVIQDLIIKGQKHKSKDSFKTIHPTPKFYDTFSNIQLGEIITNLEINREIPHKYTYFKKGAETWEDYASRSFDENLTNTVTNTDEILNTDLEYYLKQAKQGQKVNIIDIGVGDATTVKRFVEKIYKAGKLNKYIAVDISPEMLEIAKKNVLSWFGEDFPFATAVKDITRDSIDDLLFFDSEYNKNLILFVGSTIENERNQLKILLNIQNSLSKDDLFLVGHTLDSDKAKGYFDFDTEKTADQQQAVAEDDYKDWQDMIVPNLIGLGHENFDVEVAYQEGQKCRMTKLILKSDTDIEFKRGNFYRLVSFRKGEKIITWRHHHHSLIEVLTTLEKADFVINRVSISDDMFNTIITCKRK
jgi:uncharacterized SAM-dependent methyltransferase